MYVKESHGGSTRISEKTTHNNVHYKNSASFNILIHYSTINDDRKMIIW